jgi:hypothetical protein
LINNLLDFNRAKNKKPEKPNEKHSQETEREAVQK